MKDHITTLYSLTALNFCMLSILMYAVIKSVKTIEKAIKEKKESEENGKEENGKV